jgi:site-specific recombinase XerD
MLRHTFATYMADRHGKEITRAFLGHSSSAATDTYMHLVPNSYRTYMNMHPHQTQPLEAADEE